MLHSWGCSDPALHRCIIAGQAWQKLREDEGKFKYLLWVDDDMTFSDNTVQLMRHCCELANVAISGLYCKRGCSSSFALRQWEGPEKSVLLAPKDGGEMADIRLQPVIGGMGCLMIPRDAFIEHVKSVPNVHRKFPDGKTTDMPGVCSSGFCPDERGKLGWLSEDLVYGQSMWHWSCGIYAVPITWGHVSEVQLIPGPQSVWLNDQSEEIDEELDQLSETARSC